MMVIYVLFCFFTLLLRSSKVTPNGRPKRASSPRGGFSDVGRKQILQRLRCLYLDFCVIPPSALCTLAVSLCSLPCIGCGGGGHTGEGALAVCVASGSGISEETSNAPVSDL